MRGPGLYVLSDPLRLLCVAVNDQGDLITLEYPLPADRALVLAAVLELEAAKAKGTGAAVQTAAGQRMPAAMIPGGIQ